MCKLYRKVKKLDLPNYSEDNWIHFLGLLITEFREEGLTLVRLKFGDLIFYA